MIIFILVWNYKLGFFGPRKLWTDSIIYGLWVLLVTDIIVICYIYKSYFGRSFMWEMDENNDNFDYDEKTHKYIKKPKKKDN